ncbi:prepilin-type N-terminal cleavage/methylation domain-containing protein [Halomonas piscis]|uniref:Prepilin-type N-terminal cleavage/methylation domain-containing protein n=2 Tax=Halomonas piscis TaxID=3031727 RepID=A0ABY9Z1X6_9GAMM|nr:prepilin-type N-terminal cleavage/methylation domain-containing protein [Halomonas piscis]WNK20605.1 prepilin-type N-terminal cleavage/methylation domain-containing protein [Halomonas piscis]
MPISRQAGFTLIELMVALLIGSLIVLGAGALFLITLQTFNKVDELSRKQEAVIFAAHTLSARIRQNKEGGDSRYELKCEIGSEGQCKCTLSDEARKGQPLITFDRPLESIEPSEEDCAVENPAWSQNVVEIPLPLEKNGESITFHVTKREWVLTEYLSGAGENPDTSDDDDDDD